MRVEWHHPFHFFKVSTEIGNIYKRYAHGKSIRRVSTSYRSHHCNSQANTPFLNTINFSSCKLGLDSPIRPYNKSVTSPKTPEKKIPAPITEPSQTTMTPHGCLARFSPKVYKRSHQQRSMKPLQDKAVNRLIIVWLFCIFGYCVFMSQPDVWGVSMANNRKGIQKETHRVNACQAGAHHMIGNTKRAIQ
eukprot:GHVN01056951.1.p1 GENE.GHVN01056951.1~~GHVN01056951.1.p1  ORF type:complete len:190 (+),score=15.83 GHVN01056951.1:963-1532(+)